MKPPWKTYALWIGAILVVFVASVLYQPAASRTGSLLVWTNNRVYVMDIDTLTLERIAPAAPHEAVEPSPGCRGQVGAPCWIVVGSRLYRVDVGAGGSEVRELSLPVGEEYVWVDSPVSWSPDGYHVAYNLMRKDPERFDLFVISPGDEQVKIKAEDTDPDIAVAWTPGCAEGLTAPDCRIGYKKMPGQQEQGGFLASLIGYTPATEKVEQWSITPDRIFELRWSADGELYYSRPKRHFLHASDHSPAFRMPQGSQLANISPEGRYTVYYQPFTLEGCESDACIQLGVWLESAIPTDRADRRLIYNLPVSEQSGGLNFIPVWSNDGRSFVFFQNGQLIHYDVEKDEGTIWYKEVGDKLRSIPEFSPDGEAVAFVDNRGQGHSDYRLLVINPRLDPVEHVIETETGFKVLAWLPN